MSPITTLEAEIRARIDGFAAELSNLVRQSVVEVVRGALGDGTAAPRRRGLGRPRNATGPAKRGPGRPPKTDKARRGRRSSEDVQATAERVQAHVRAKPGQRMEEISVALKMPTGALTLPVSKLMAAGSLRTEGQRRGTRYYAGGGGSGAAKGRGAKAGTRKGKKVAKKA
jgi:hypothetical protein